jgi:hypothetical protein
LAVSVGSLNVRWRQPLPSFENYIRLAVKDIGIGMRPEGIP